VPFLVEIFMNDPLYLYELENSTLEKILHLDDKDKHKYFLTLIRTYYPNSDKETKSELMAAYMASFIVEYIYRNHDLLGSAFTLTYTPTGMVREMANDLYNFEESYKYQIN